MKSETYEKNPVSNVMLNIPRFFHKMARYLSGLHHPPTKINILNSDVLTKTRYSKIGIITP